MTPSADPGALARPAQRYGARRPWSRPLAVALAVLLVVAGGGWLVWAASYHADPEVASRLEGFEVVSDHEVAVTVRIEREVRSPVACVVKAQAGDHAVVGQRAVRVPAGPKTSLTRTFVVTTERPATAGVLDGCRVVERPGTGG